MMHGRWGAVAVAANSGGRDFPLAFRLVEVSVNPPVTAGFTDTRPGESA